MKESDNRRTPKWLRDIFENWFDPCPLNSNPEIDGLKIEWKNKTYCNPPYSQTTKWVLKAIEEGRVVFHEIAVDSNRAEIVEE